MILELCKFGCALANIIHREPRVVLYRLIHAELEEILRPGGQDAVLLLEAHQFPEFFQQPVCSAQVLLSFPERIQQLTRLVYKPG